MGRRLSPRLLPRDAEFSRALVAGSCFCVAGFIRGVSLFGCVCAVARVVLWVEAGLVFSSDLVEGVWVLGVMR